MDIEVYYMDIQVYYMDIQVYYMDIQVYYMDIQAISTLLCLILVLVVQLLIYLKDMLSIPPSWKVTFSGTQKPTPPTVFNLPVSDWVHCEEETGVYYQLSRNYYKLLLFYKFLKLFILSKKCALFKKFPKNYSFFLKRDNWAYIYIRMSLICQHVNFLMHRVSFFYLAIKY